MLDYLIFAVAHAASGQPVNRWLRHFDPEAHEGMGEADFTDNPSEALCFPTMAAALVYVMQQPQTRPLRDDGAPNRPLRAFSLLFHTTAEAHELARGPGQHLVPRLRPVD